MNIARAVSSSVHRHPLRFVCLAALGTALLFHGPLLRAWAHLLIVPLPNTTADGLVLCNGDARHLVAAAWFAQNPGGRIWHVQPRPTRLADLGIVASDLEQMQRELAELGVPAEMQSVIPRRASDDHLVAVVQWISSQADPPRLLYLVSDLESRRARYLFNQQLPEGLRDRVIVWPLAHQEFSVDTWWKSRSGAKAVFFATLQFAYAVAQGPDTFPSERWDPDAYEQQLQVGATP